MKNRILVAAMGLAICVLGVVSPASGDITNGLVAYYPFDENANDVTGNGNNGTVFGATLTTDRFGDANRAYTFDGSSTYIQLPANTGSLSGATHFSITAWVKPSANNDWCIFSDWNTGSNLGGVPVGVQFDATGFAMIGGAPVNFSSGVVRTSQWNQIVMTFDGTQSVPSNRVTMYYNGVVVALGNGQETTPSSVGTLGNMTTIGAAVTQSSFWNFFNGAIDDIRIYNRALSSNDVAELYSVESSPCGACIGPQGSKGDTGAIGATGAQGPAGIGFTQGAYLTLTHGTAAPVGFTMLGTTVLRYKYLVGRRHRTKSVTLDLYQKD